MLPKEAIARIDLELAAAENARAAGNEPRARVCVRRAAGIAIQEVYKSLGEPLPDNNVIGALTKLKSDSRIDSVWRSFAGLLLLRVNENHSLPVKADILAETRRFIDEVENILRGKLLER